jgi:TonB family protein
MSGENVLAFLRKPESDPYRERFEIESDRRLFGCMGSGSVFGLSLAVYALSIQIIVDPIGGGDPPCIDCIGKPEPPIWPKTPPEIRLKLPTGYHGKLHGPDLAKRTSGPGKPGQEAPKPKTAKPAVKEPGTLVAKVIGSLRGTAGASAYDLIPKAVRNVDLNKLEEFGSLTRTGETRIGGRRGIQSTEFNMAYFEDGTGDGSNKGVTMPGFTGGAIEGEVRKPKEIGKPIAIDQITNNTTRSTSAILAVIRSRSPGLRHIYNTHLKTRPGLAGKITLRFAIAPSGEIVDVGLAGSTTMAPDFDADIVRAVKSWRFDPVKAIGNDLVTVPFNFSE